MRSFVAFMMMLMVMAMGILGISLAFWIGNTFGLKILVAAGIVSAIVMYLVFYKILDD